MSCINDLVHEWIALATAAHIATERAKAAERAVLQGMNEKGVSSIDSPLGRTEMLEGRLRYTPRNDYMEKSL